MPNDYRRLLIGLRSGMCAGYTSAITFSASNNWFALSQETFIICVKMDTWTGDIQEEWWISFLVIFWYNAAFNRPSNRLTGPKSSPKNISHTNTIFKGRGDRGSSQITFLYDNHDCHDFLAKWNEMKWLLVSLTVLNSNLSFY